MRLGIASDHRGYKLKQQIQIELSNKYEFIDYGTNNEESCDYPDYAFKLCEGYLNNEIDFGIAICGSGIGISIACNKVKGIRCAKVDTKEEAIATRNDNDTQIIAFGERKTIKEAIEMIENFVNTKTSMEEKHVRRRNKVMERENV